VNRILRRLQANWHSDGLRPFLGLLLLFAASASAQQGAEAWVAWPPTRYESAELILHRAAGGGGALLRVRVTARGLDQSVELPVGAAFRLSLPPEARCAPGLDACGIHVIRTEGEDPFRVLLQSPETAGIPDTLVRTAHDVVRFPAPTEMGLRHRLLSWPNSPEFAEALSFASFVASAVDTMMDGPTGCGFPGSVMLSPPDVFTVACSDAEEDLSGALFNSNRPMMVLSGNVAAAVPFEVGTGLSGDLLLDAPLPLEPLALGSTYLVPPLPRRESHAGLGDIIRVVAGEDLELRVRDDLLVLAGGEVLDFDTAAPGADLTLRLDADGPLLAWQLSKSRSLRGYGDGAAVPVVPVELFTEADAFFAPDGYGEGSFLIIVAPAGATPQLEGAPILAAPVPGPGGDFHSWTVDLGGVPAPAGLLAEIQAEGGLGAWVFGMGGYKAHGHVAARVVPGIPAPSFRIHRSAEPSALPEVAVTSERRWEDSEPGELLFFRVEGDEALLLSLCGESACLSW
jgi:hypothetical protein